MRDQSIGVTGYTLWSLILAFCVLGSTVTWAKDWPMFRKNALRNGLTEGKGSLKSDSVMKKWECYLPRPITFSSPAVGDVNGDGILEVVIGCDNFHLYVLRADSGKVLWSYPTGSLVQSSPLLIDLNNNDTLDIVFASFDNKVYAVDGNRAFLWKYSTGSWIFSSPAGGDIDLDGVVDIVVGSLDSCIYVLNGTNGNLKWRYKTGGDVRSSPALGDINGDDTLEVVIGSSDCKLYVLNHRGNILWTYTTGGMIWSTPALGDLNGDGYLDVGFGSLDGHIYGLKGQTGELLWSPYNVGGEIHYESPALADIDDDGFLEIITGSFGGELLHCIEGESGTKKWEINPSGEDSWMIQSSPAIGDVDGDNALEIVLGTHDFFCKARKANGDKFWELPTKDDPHSSPALADIDMDGELEVVIATTGGNVLAIDNRRRDAVEESEQQTQGTKIEVYPNPFIRGAIIEFKSLGVNELVELQIYDVTGRIVRKLSTENGKSHRVVWDGNDSYGREVMGGIYFCKMIAGNWVKVGKLIKLM